MNRRVKMGLVLVIAGAVLGLAFAGLGVVDNNRHEGQAVVEPGTALVMSFQQNPQFLIVSKAVFQVRVVSGASFDFYVLNDEGYAAYRAGQSFSPSPTTIKVEHVDEVNDSWSLASGHWQVVIDNTNYGTPASFLASTVHYVISAGGIGSAIVIGGVSAGVLLAVTGAVLVAVARRRETSSGGPPPKQEGERP